MNFRGKIRFICYMLFGIILFSRVIAFAQEQGYFFPSPNSEEWNTLDAANLGWNKKQLDSLVLWLGEKQSKGFIVLHKGQMVVEKYYDDFGRDSLWYWASAGKSLTAFLVGMAQEQALLSIRDTTSKWLGEGWTSCLPDQEKKITIWHQLTMTTGLETTGMDLNCMTPTCLKYRVDAGNRWFYHNAPYRLLQDVLASSANQTFNLYTYNQLYHRVGIKGAWINYVRYGRARDLARFGLLMLSNGVWDGDTLMHDQQYFKDMIRPSQNLNPSYGYLWWLNGQSSHVLPGLAISFNGSIVPGAPADMFAALGKNDQKIYVVPSMDLVVVRIGEKANEGKLALSTFDQELWEKLMQVMGSSYFIATDKESGRTICYSPRDATLTLKMKDLPRRLRIMNMEGSVVKMITVNGIRTHDVSRLNKGTYICFWYSDKRIYREKIMVF